MEHTLIPKYDVNEVEITLLTVEEANVLPAEIRCGCNRVWWLRSPGHGQGCAADVNHVGVVFKFGSTVSYAYNTVRPAFKITNLMASNLDKILVGKTCCTVIAPGLALADKPICYHRYDAESNNWETSELKAFIESDEFKALL